jgi:hypothetical protein
MKSTVIHGVHFDRRPPSSACPKGAWFSRHYHTHWSRGEWAVFETGVGRVGGFVGVIKAKGRIAQLESEREP